MGSVRSQLSNDLCTGACSSVQKRLRNSVPVPSQTPFYALLDSQRSSPLTVFHLERSPPLYVNVTDHLSNTGTDRRTCVHLRIAKYRTLGKNPTYSTGIVQLCAATAPKHASYMQLHGRYSIR
ncbi:hypothetical protein GBAR_LOCUS25568 [Geodia barretti]|uniref:Uncharacterized protein n=1 Tax=Geodia barretti TaxID=519541 RepID=A0AA35TET0_GEOBA|nr:hypothetical protein GBAR_LOCUS25568 [Geodia barretti]